MTVSLTEGWGLGSTLAQQTQVLLSQEETLICSGHEKLGETNGILRKDHFTVTVFTNGLKGLVESKRPGFGY